MNQIEELVLYFGSKNKMAKALGITLPAVSKWKKSIPVSRAYQIQVLTKGKFKAKNLTKKDGENG